LILLEAASIKSVLFLFQKLHHLYELRNLLSLRHLIASRNTLSKNAIEQEIGKLTRLEYINLEGTDIKGGYQCLQYIFGRLPW